ncbi:SseB family protein [uncultured Flavobacterium sp.]|uniref:SseB family protein n=1 Tax=uncultured Flavobacterium sp. TaxID=165435 RepID=UPI0030EB2AC0|tara:strand:- start:54471 stop:54896 length:426 start_codon:yes stop_codon:yes gene_type:complete
MSNTDNTTFKPDNTNLLATIKDFQVSQNQETFMAVLEELQGDNAYLLVPTSSPVTGENPEKGWTTLEKGAQLSFTSVFETEGKLVMGVFTSQTTLMSWATETKPFVTLPAKEVLEIAVENRISQLIIDSNQESMFVLGRTV